MDMVMRSLMVVLMERCSPAKMVEEAATEPAAALRGGGGPRGQRLLGPPSSLWMVLQ
jgi:hypothetical protein